MSKHLFYAVISAVILFYPPHLLAESLTPASTQIEGISHYDRVATPSMPVTALSVTAESTQEFFQFKALGRTFDLLLEQNMALSQGKVTWLGDAAEVPAAAVTHYKGQVKDEADSWVRITRRQGVMEGMIRSKNEIYVIEPAKNLIPEASGMVVYRLSDSDAGLPPHSCALENPDKARQLSRYAQNIAQSADVQPLLDELESAAATVTKVLSLGVLIDHEFFLKHGDNSVADIQTLLNQIDGIYQETLGVSIRVAKTVVLSSPDDPFSDTSDAGTLLTELQTFVNSPSNPFGDVGLTHLFTGRDIDSGVAGIAFVGTLCRSDAGVGLSADFTQSNRIAVLLTAHEMGHNFNAPHDSQEGSTCASTPFGFIMNPFLSNDLELTFSDCSLGQINPLLASVNCLAAVSPLPEVGLYYRHLSVLGEVATGLPINYSAEVTNIGKGTLTGLTLTGELPSGVTFVRGGPPGGFCRVAGQTFTCTMGAVPPREKNEVRFTVIPSAPGLLEITLNVMLGQDILKTGTVSKQVNLLPDLKIEIAPTARITRGTPFDYHLTVSNVSQETTAEAVDVVSYLPESVEILSVKSSKGSCQVSAQTVSCGLGDMLAGNASTLTFNVNPTQARPLVFHAEIVFFQTDANDLDNEVFNTKNVFIEDADDGTGDDDEGGNGAITGFWLLAFLLVFLLRFRAIGRK